jgi:hypothetical protein
MNIKFSPPLLPLIMACENTYITHAAHTAEHTHTQHNIHTYTREHTEQTTDANAAELYDLMVIRQMHVSNDEGCKNEMIGKYGFPAPPCESNG